MDETVIIDNYLFQYVGYEFQSGPWRDAIIKFGLDPRSDPQYRVYQSMLFAFDSHIKPFKKATGIPARGGDRALLDPKPEQDRGLGANSHIFDGINVGLDSKVWQVCDITEPLIKSILGTAELRETCHVWWTPYHKIMNFLTNVFRSSELMAGSIMGHGPEPKLLRRAK